MPQPTPPLRASEAARRRVLASGERQPTLAKVLGISQAQVSRRLSGQVPFTLADLDKLAAHLGIPVAELLEAPASLVDQDEADS